MSGKSLIFLNCFEIRKNIGDILDTVYSVIHCKGLLYRGSFSGFPFFFGLFRFTAALFYPFPTVCIFFNYFSVSLGLFWLSAIIYDRSSYVLSKNIAINKILIKLPLLSTDKASLIWVLLHTWIMTFPCWTDSQTIDADFIHAEKRIWTQQITAKNWQRGELYLLYVYTLSQWAFTKLFDLI